MLYYPIHTLAAKFLREMQEGESYGLEFPDVPSTIRAKSMAYKYGRLHGRRYRYTTSGTKMIITVQSIDQE